MPHKGNSFCRKLIKIPWRVLPCNLHHSTHDANRMGRSLFFFYPSLLLCELDVVLQECPYVLKGFHGRHHFEELLKAHELREDSIQKARSPLVPFHYGFSKGITILLSSYSLVDFSVKIIIEALNTLINLFPAESPFTL